MWTVPKQIILRKIKQTFTQKLLKGNRKPNSSLHAWWKKNYWTSVFSECSVILQWMFSKMNWISSLHVHIICVQRQILMYWKWLEDWIIASKYWIWIIQTVPNIVMTSSLILLKCSLLLLYDCSKHCPSILENDIQNNKSKFGKFKSCQWLALIISLKYDSFLHFFGMFWNNT